MTAVALDYMARLASHMRAVELANGRALVRSDAHYFDLLDDEEIRSSIAAHCRSHGFACGFIGTNAGWSLRIYKEQR